MSVRKGPAAPIVIGVVGVAILLFLGAWQVQRLSWKEGLIAEIETRMAEAPAALPALLDADRDNRLRVAVTGRLGREEIHVLHSIKMQGPGFRVITPMEIEPDGQGATRRIMVDLGFVPERLKSITGRGETVRLQERSFVDEVTGFLLWPNETDGYTPEPDMGRNIWFARDVDKMAAVLGTEPVLVVAERHPDGNMPKPIPPKSDLPNRHLEYALTWFGLAIVWTIMSIVWLRAELRRTRKASGRASKDA